MQSKAIKLLKNQRRKKIFYNFFFIFVGHRMNNVVNLTVVVLTVIVLTVIVLRDHSVNSLGLTTTQEYY